MVDRDTKRNGFQRHPTILANCVHNKSTCVAKTTMHKQKHEFVTSKPHLRF